MIKEFSFLTPLYPINLKKLGGIGNVLRLPLMEYEYINIEYSNCIIPRVNIKTSLIKVLKFSVIQTKFSIFL